MKTIIVIMDGNDRTFVTMFLCKNGDYVFSTVNRKDSPDDPVLVLDEKVANAIALFLSAMGKNAFVTFA